MHDSSDSRRFHSLHLPPSQCISRFSLLWEFHLPFAVGRVRNQTNLSRNDQDPSRVSRSELGSISPTALHSRPDREAPKSPLLSRPLDLHVITSSAALYGGRMATIHNGTTIQIYSTVKLSPNKTKLHFTWNRGLYVQGYSPTIHLTSVNDLASTTTIDILSRAMARTQSSMRPLKIVHGAIHAISWGFLLRLGAVGARYLRHIEAVGAAWFYAHAAVQISGVFLGTVGFSMGVRLGQLLPGRVYGLHRKLAFATFCLEWLQTVALLFRPKTTHKYRKYWKSYHH